MAYESISFTQGLFLCCLFIFGPAFGFVAVYRHIDSRIGGFWAFLFACFAAYAGWFISGIAALLLHPDYGSSHGPSEPVAAMFAIPGFVTGYIGLQILKSFSDRKAGPKKADQDAIGQPAATSQLDPD